MCLTLCLTGARPFVFEFTCEGEKQTHKQTKKIVHLQGHAQPNPLQRWTIRQILGTECNIQIFLERNVNIARVTATVFQTRTKHTDFGPNKQDDYCSQSQQSTHNAAQLCHGKTIYL